MPRSAHPFPIFIDEYQAEINAESEEKQEKQR
jgi:hypothetical protein